MSKGLAVEQLNNLCNDAWRLKEEITELDGEIDQRKKELQVISKQIQDVLQENKLPNFRNSNGLATIRRDWRCSVPKEPKKRQEFFDWLKQKDWFNEWITVHSKKLNSEYKKLYEAAAKEGEIFEIPGVGEPTIIESLTFRRK